MDSIKWKIGMGKQIGKVFFLMAFHSNLESNFLKYITILVVNLFACFWVVIQPLKNLLIAYAFCSAHGHSYLYLFPYLPFPHLKTKVRIFEPAPSLFLHFDWTNKWWHFGALYTGHQPASSYHFFTLQVCQPKLNAQWGRDHHLPCCSGATNSLLLLLLCNYQRQRVAWPGDTNAKMKTHKIAVSWMLVQVSWLKQSQNTSKIIQFYTPQLVQVELILWNMNLSTLENMLI